MLHLRLHFICFILFLNDRNVQSKFKFFDYKEIPAYGSLYKMHETPKNLDEAWETCKSENADLYYPTSLSNLQDVFNELNPFYKDIWLPITDRVNEGDFLGLYGRALDDLYIKWGPYQPNNARDDEDCVVISQYLESYDTNCFKAFKFICVRTAEFSNNNKNVKFIEDIENSKVISILSQIKPSTEYTVSSVTDESPKLDGLNKNSIESTGDDLLNWDEISTVYNYIPEVDVLYKFHKDIKTWHEARSFCKSENASLAMPANEREAIVLKNILKYSNSTYEHAFLGFHDIFKEGDFITEDGKSLEYYYHVWQEKQPDNFEGDENCGSITKDGKLDDVKCSQPLVFFCQKKQPVKIYKTVYHYAENLKKSYKLHLNAKLWNDAFLICTSEDGHLAVVDSVEEKDFLMKMLQVAKEKHEDLKSYESALLGFHDMFNEGEYVTVIGENFQTNIIDWENVNESSDKSKNCGAITVKEKLVEFSCETPAIFFCEKSDNSIIHHSEDSIKDTYTYTHFPELQISYRFHSIPRKWNHARRFCISQNANLAMPKNSPEADAVLEIFKTNTLDTVESIHLGFHDAFYEGEYVTDDGESLQYYYKKWSENQPNDFNMSQNCVSMLRNGRLDDRSCENEAVFICQHRMDSMENSKRKNCYTDDSAYIYDSDLNHGYKLHLNPKPWGTARFICASEGGYLAIVNSQKELDFLLNIANDADNRIMHVKHPDYILLGFHDLFEESHFTTVNGEDLLKSGYVSWENEPKINRQKNCGSMKLTGKLSDFSCFESAIFFCEISNWTYD